MKAKFLFLIFNVFLLSIHSEAQITNKQTLQSNRVLSESYSQKSSTFTAFKSSFNANDSIKKGVLTLFSHKKKNFSLVVNPAFDLLHGYHNQDRNVIYNYSLGVDVLGKLNKWNFGFTYLHFNSNPMQYQKQFIVENRVLPGFGVSSGVKTFRANYLSSFLNYKLNQFLDLEVGYGRNFIGDGYRSLLLSDFSNASPYVKVSTSFWKLQYVNLFSSHQNIYNVEGLTSLYKKKYSATHFLDWKVSKWFSFGLFETIIWQADEENYYRGFDVNYLNPVIFYRPVEFSIGSSDNALVGANIKFTLVENYILYSQIIFDEFLLDELRADFNQYRNPNQDIKSGWWANKYGLQLGLRTFDFLNIGGLQTQLEFNLVRPYTYAHSSPSQSYSNYNLSLAHPLGANFHEFVSIITYQKKRWLGKLQFNQSRKGLSPTGLNFGDNLQLSNSSRTKEYENYIGQGEPEFIQYAELGVGYVLDKNTNTSFSIGAIWREQKVREIALVDNAVFFSLKTSLFNQYWDY